MIIICDYCGHAIDTAVDKCCPNCCADYAEARQKKEREYQKEMQDFANNLGVDENRNKQKQQELIRKIIKIAAWCIMGIVITKIANSMLVLLLALLAII